MQVTDEAKKEFGDWVLNQTSAALSSYEELEKLYQDKNPNLSSWYRERINELQALCNKHLPI